MANLHIFVTFILAVFSKPIFSNFKNLNMASPITSHIPDIESPITLHIPDIESPISIHIPEIETPITLHISDIAEIINILTPNPNSVPDKSTSKVLGADSHLKCLEKEIDERLGAPEYMDFEATSLHNFDHILPNLWLPEESHESFTTMEGEIQDHQDELLALDDHGQIIEWHQNGLLIDKSHTSEMKDQEQNLIQEKDASKNKKVNQEILGSLEKSYQMEPGDLNIKKRKRKHRYNDQESQHPMFDLNDDFASSSDKYFYDMKNKNYQIDERTLLHELHWQAQLAMWHIPGFSATIKSAFHAFEYHAKANSAQFSKHTFKKDKVPFAIKHIRSQIVMGFFGALKVVFHGQDDIPDMKALMEDGWNFIYKYFGDEFNISQPNTHFVPSMISHRAYLKEKVQGEIISHVLTLSENSIISSKIVFRLLDQWYQTTQYQSSISRIPVNYTSFIQSCDALQKKKGESASIWRSCSHKPTDYENEIEIERSELVGVVNGDTKKEPPHRSFGIEIQRKGNELIQREIPRLKGEIKDFFKNLRSKVRDVYAPQANYQALRVSYHQSVRENLETINKAISIAEKTITPKYMGVVSSIHPQIKSNESWNLLVQSAWDHLKTYFNRWPIFLSERKHASISPTSNCRAENVDWSDDILTIAYLASIKQVSHVSPQMVWFLLDLWYDGITTSKDIETHNLLPRISLPDQHYLRNDYLTHVYSKRKNRKLSFS
ncbi:hypothetical protein DFH28DRAFT_949018 [Melampsora americana]|nr:hypothetical protein DFH28DRAFT_949018 [Melampsora americana]